MKIGILTFHRAINYGAVLQAYALKSKLEELGNQVEVVDYKNEYFSKIYSVLYFKSFSLKDIILAFYNFPIRIKKNKRFEDFINKNLNLSREVNSQNIKDIEEDYDLFVCGSDQVWNYRLNDFDKTYFLDFLSDSKKKNSYAASFGVSTIPVEHQREYKRLLSDFNNIAVREYEGLQIVKDLVGRDARVTLDPVFLLSKEEWEKIAEEPSIKDDYILVYKLNKTDVFEYAEKLSKVTGLKVVVVQAKMRINKSFIAERTTSPEEFVGWFKNAKYIVTDSFHGLAFSILFNKSFSVHLDKRAQNHNSRALTLLKLLSLEDRVGDVDEVEKIFEAIDYGFVNETLKSNVDECVEYLKQISDGGEFDEDIQ